MFRLKKNSGGEPEEKTAAPRPEPVEETPAAKTPPRRALPVPGRPLAGPSFPVDIPRRTADVPPARGDAAATVRDKALSVGKNVRLKGEVLDCDRLVVEGDAELKLSGQTHLQIGASGVFRGTADVTEADIGGTFHGELLVRGRLTVRASGRIDGTVRYEQIVVEAGGRITGAVSGLDAADDGTPQAQAAARLPGSAGGESREEGREAAGISGVAAETFVAPGERS